MCPWMKYNAHSWKLLIFSTQYVHNQKTYKSNILHEKSLRSKQIIRVFVAKYTNFLDADVNSEWSGTTRDRITSSMQNQPKIFLFIWQVGINNNFCSTCLEPIFSSSNISRIRGTWSVTIGVNYSWPYFEKIA